MFFINKKKLKLVAPDLTYKKSFLKLVQKAVLSSEKIPWFIEYSLYDFEGIVKILNDNAENKSLKENEVQSSTYFAVFGKKVAGVINIKHRLNEKLKIYGHIGYYVSLAYRKKGIATKMLQLALVESEKLNLDTVTICVDKNNIASKKVAIKNDLTLTDEFFDKNQNIMIERYSLKLRKHTE